MKFGCCLNMVAEGPDGTGIEHIEKLAQLGYDYVELPTAQMMELDDEAFAAFKELQTLPQTDRSFFEGYAGWIENSSSGRLTEERWSYYESRRQICEVVSETAPGSREKDGYRISSKRTKERLEEMMRGADATTKIQE